MCIRDRDKLEERIAWVRQLLENQQEGEDAEEIVRSIKSDIAPEEVFVFTPKGDVISLPAGATVLDFAYAIHSDVYKRQGSGRRDQHGECGGHARAGHRSGVGHSAGTQPLLGLWGSLHRADYHPGKAGTEKLPPVMAFVTGGVC